MVRVISVDQNPYLMNNGKKIGIKFLDKNLQIESQTMGVGVKVLIKTKDEKGHNITEYGYIVRRLNAQVYEVWGESSQSIFLLSPEEFTELPKE
jgi:hypothetical protein